MQSSLRAALLALAAVAAISPSITPAAHAAPATLATRSITITGYSHFGLGSGYALKSIARPKTTSQAPNSTDGGPKVAKSETPTETGYETEPNGEGKDGPQGEDK